MDLLLVYAPALAARFPRPRGDGPASGGQQPDRARVSPPTRGWTPRHRVVSSSSTGVSPPTRGWTPPPVDMGSPRRGFPAHAGMDPSPRSGPTFRFRFPRPRGDGPRVLGGPGKSAAVSPHTRGWTVRGQDHPQVRRGFPAHAGMDPIEWGRTPLHEDRSAEPNQSPVALPRVLRKSSSAGTKSVNITTVPPCSVGASARANLASAVTRRQRMRCASAR